MKRYPSAFLATTLALLLLDALVTFAQSKPAFAPDKMDMVLYVAAYDAVERTRMSLSFVIFRTPGT
jgi:hypothetical protein